MKKRGITILESIIGIVAVIILIIILWLIISKVMSNA